MASLHLGQSPAISITSKTTLHKLSMTFEKDSSEGKIQATNNRVFSNTCPNILGKNQWIWGKENNRRRPQEIRTIRFLKSLASIDHNVIKQGPEKANRQIQTHLIYKS